MAAEARILARGEVRPGELFRFPEETMLLLSGIGAERAGQAARFLLENGATALMSWGVCGGLEPTFPPGSLLIPKIIISIAREPYTADLLWRQQLKNRLKGHMNIYEGPLAESKTVLSDPAAKAALGKQTGAIAVDMESAAVARIAKEGGVPFLAVRAIADDAETAIPGSLLHSLNHFGEVLPFRLLLSLLRAPSAVFILPRLGRNFRLARTALAAVARNAGDSLLSPRLHGEDVPAGSSGILGDP